MNCLELIAKAFGYDNWNILSAKIEAARPRAIDAEASHRHRRAEAAMAKLSIVRSAQKASTTCES